MRPFFSLPSGLRLVLILFVLLTVAFADEMSSPATSHAQDTDELQVPSLELDPSCTRFDRNGFTYLLPDTEIGGETATCGIMYTLENPADKNSIVIEIAFVILYSFEDPGLHDPVIYLAGGPGGSGLLGAEEWVLSPLRQERDIILVDQRGAGYSSPSINCDFYRSTDVRECWNRLQQIGADLGNYNTGTNAADLGNLMRLLQQDYGYTQFNAYGVSYGARLGIALIREYDELLRSVVLDSAYPPTASSAIEIAVNAQRAFDTLFAYCAADLTCNRTYPNLEQVFYEVVADLYAQPLEYEEPAYLGDTYDGSDFINDLFIAMYRTDFLPGLPAVIYLYSEGRIQEADELLYNGPPGAEDGSSILEFYDAYPRSRASTFYDSAIALYDSDALFFIVECQEEYAFWDYESAVAYTDAANVDPLVAKSQLQDLRDGFERCEYWTFNRAPEIENERVFSDVPTLVLAGDFDPITPPRWGKTAAESLSNSYFFTFPGVGHAVLQGGDCPLDVVLEFLKTPEVVPDASCRDEMHLEFYVP